MKKYLKQYTYSLFKELSSGTLIFFRWGIIGHGVELPTPELKDTLCQFIYLHVLFSLLCSILVVIFIHPKWLTFICLISLATYICVIYHYTRDLPISPAKLTYYESLMNTAKQSTYCMLWIGLILSMVFDGIITISLLIQKNQWFTHGLLILVFTGLIFNYLYLISIKKHLPH